MKRLKRCLTRKLQIMWIASAAIPIVVLLSHTLIYSRTSLVSQARDTFIRNARETGGDLQGRMMVDTDNVKNLARMPFVVSALAEWQENLKASGQGPLEWVQTPESVTLSNDLVRQLRMVKQPRICAGITVIDKDFIVIGSTEPHPAAGTVLGGDNSVAELPLEAIAERASLQSKPVIELAAMEGRLQCVIAQRVTDDGNNNLGIVIWQQSQEEIGRLLSAGESNEGVVAVRLVTSDVVASAAMKISQRADLADAGHIRRQLRQLTDQDETSDLIQWTYENEQGHTIWAAAWPLGSPGWAVVTEADQAAVLAGPRALVRHAIGLGTLLFVGLAVFGWLTASRMTLPITHLMDAVRRLDAGDLTIAIRTDGHDETACLGQSLQNVVERVKDIVMNSDQTADRIAAVRSEILSSCEQQACSARQQSSAVSETTSAAAQLSKTSEQIGDNIKTISQMANHVLTGMEKIKEATDQTNRILTSLNEKSKQIGNITELIDDVADQTNLLAVNASIEAARAGEQGRGFTVVADQISKLADSTAKSTKDITSLVEMIQHEMSNAIIAMEQSLVSVEEEIQLAKDSASRSQEIAMSANQQISGSRQIAEAMTSIDETMKQIVYGAQCSADSASQLVGLADELKSSMSRFKIGKPVDPSAS